MRLGTIGLVAALISGLAGAACDDERGGGADAGADGGRPAAWAEADIGWAKATTREEVTIRLIGFPEESAVTDAESYRLTGPEGPLRIESLTYDPEANTVVLVTEEQTLGVELTLDILASGEPMEGMSEVFLSADTATFWAINFATYGAYELVAERRGVGEHCLVYIEEGMYPAGVPETVQRFDEVIYPTLTELLIEAPDQDENGRIIILGLNGGWYYGGYFNPGDTMPDGAYGGRSNEAEIFYIAVESGYLDYETVVPHEFQHLLYRERHGDAEHWDYHDEGLAEAAVRVVNGYHPWAVNHYYEDPSGVIGNGMSLVNWNWGDYNNYVIAYMFWNYVAGQLDGVDSFGEIFDLDVGDPGEVNAFLQAELGRDFAEVQRDMMLATWVDEPDGLYSYGEMIDLPSSGPPTVLAGTSSVDLQPFGGAWFLLEADQVDYPGTEGENIVYSGVNGAGQVDLLAPFDISGGGGLLALNTHQEWVAYPAEHSGPDLPSAGKKEGDRQVDWSRVPRTWLDPPPIDPADMTKLDAWRAAAEARIEAMAD